MSELGNSAVYRSIRMISVLVQVFGRRNDGLSRHSEGRRPKSAKAGNRGLGTAVVLASVPPLARSHPNALDEPSTTAARE
jgi:hypothetical protein